MCYQQHKQVEPDKSDEFKKGIVWLASHATKTHPKGWFPKWLHERAEPQDKAASKREQEFSNWLSKFELEDSPPPLLPYRADSEFAELTQPTRCDRLVLKDLKRYIEEGDKTGFRDLLNDPSVSLDLSDARKLLAKSGQFQNDWAKISKEESELRAEIRLCILDALVVSYAECNEDYKLRDIARKMLLHIEELGLIDETNTNGLSDAQNIVRLRSSLVELISKWEYYAAGASKRIISLQEDPIRNQQNVLETLKEYIRCLDHGAFVDMCTTEQISLSLHEGKYLIDFAHEEWAGAEIEDRRIINRIQKEILRMVVTSSPDGDMAGKILPHVHRFTSSEKERITLTRYLEEQLKLPSETTSPLKVTSVKRPKKELSISLDVTEIRPPFEVDADTMKTLRAWMIVGLSSQFERVCRQKNISHFNERQAAELIEIGRNAPAMRSDASSTGAKTSRQGIEKIIAMIERIQSESQR